MIKFSKMHGIGNDYIFVYKAYNNLSQPEAIARSISDRNFGVGADGLVIIEPGKIGDFKMTMYNADGTEGKMCGNAARCIGKFVYEKGFTNNTKILLETKSGLKELLLHINAKGNVSEVTLDLGEPVFLPDQIPVKLPGEQIVDYEISYKEEKWFMTCVNMGNPHAIFFVENSLEKIKLGKIGPYFENMDIFPNRTNVEVVKILDNETIEMRVWERGSGETLACGTGAAAAAVAAIIKYQLSRTILVHLKGGDLTVNWRKNDNHVIQTGPAAFVFEGIWKL